MSHVKSFSLLTFALIFSTLTLTAQSGAAKGETSDPKAKALLDKVKALYQSFQTLETNFSLALKLPEQKKEETQKGKIYQNGDKYRVEMNNNQLIISDGKSLWHKMDNTVRLTNATSKNSSELLSPKDLMTIYEKNDYIFAIFGENAEGWSKKATIITFKPMNKKSEYSQIRVAIDQKSNNVVSITAFGKDQSRYKLSLEQPISNKKYAAEFFTFEQAKYPNVKVEDLRID
jgi:outer membrane lipoprotein carrier protein